MKKIDLSIMKNIRDEFMKKYEGMSLQELSVFEHSEFASYLYTELYNTPGIDREALYDVSLYNLYKSDNNGNVMKEEYEENLILMRNNGEIPLGLTIEEFNVLDLGSYAWVEYGDYYYDIECMEGSKTLFELPYFKRYIDILKSYLNKNELMNGLKIATDNLEIIKDFNNYFINECKKYDSIVHCINNMVKKCNK